MATKKTGKRSKTSKHLSKSKKLEATKPLSHSAYLYVKGAKTGG
jgi:hypothetical protein